jgi:GH35 family endo-1,4-beta-xylanase
LAQPAAHLATSGTWTKAELRAILREHIFAEVGHFRGQIWAWDVVNEAIDDTRYGLPANMQQNLHRFAALGLKTAVTEAGVRSDLPVDAPKNPGSGGCLQLHAGELPARAKLHLLHRLGFTDKYSWVPSTFPGEGYANLYTEDYKPKPAYDALRRDLALAAGIKKHR